MKLVLPDGTTYQDAPTVPTTPFWRVRHDYELGPLWRVGLPEVFILNSLGTPFGKDWQLLTFAMNGGIDPRKWRSVFAYNRAFNNGTGFNDDLDPRADYVNGLDLNAPLPRWDKTRVCGGGLVSGRVDGVDLVVDILDGRGPAPTLDWIKAHPQFFFRAVNSIEGGVSNFPQNGGYPVYIPLVGSGEARIPLAGLEAI